MVVGVGEFVGTDLIQILMAFMLATEPSVVAEEVMMADQVRLAGGERCDTDYFLPNARGGQRDVSPTIVGTAGDVDSLWEARLAFWCGTRGRDSRLRL